MGSSFRNWLLAGGMVSVMAWVLPDVAVAGTDLVVPIGASSGGSCARLWVHNPSDAVALVEVQLLERSWTNGRTWVYRQMLEPEATAVWNDPAWQLFRFDREAVLRISSPHSDLIVNSGQAPACAPEENPRPVVAPVPAGLAIAAGELLRLVGDPPTVHLVELAGAAATVAVVQMGDDGRELRRRILDLGPNGAAGVELIQGSARVVDVLGVEGDGRVVATAAGVTVDLSQSVSRTGLGDAPLSPSSNGSPRQPRASTGPVDTARQTIADAVVAAFGAGDRAPGDVDGDGSTDAADLACVAVTVFDPGFGCAVDITAEHDHLGETWTGTGSLDIDSSAPFGSGVLEVANTGTGSALRLEAAANAVSVVSPGGDGMYVSSPGDTGVTVVGSGTDGMYVQSAGRDGLRVYSASANGVTVSSANDNGVLVQSAGSPSEQYSSSYNDGVEVNGAEGNGLYVGRADRNGVRVAHAGMAGLAVLSADEGVLVDFAATSGFRVSSSNFGLRVGTASFDGVLIESAGADGIRLVEAYDDGLDIHTVADRGVMIGSAGDDGVYVAAAGDKGVVAAGDNTGVWANTTQTNQEWGVYTGDKIYAGAGRASAGPELLVAANGGMNALEKGDLVAVRGLSAPFGDSGTPVVLVEDARLATGASVLGVVSGRFVLEEEQEGVTGAEGVEEQALLSARGAEGPAAPGEHLLVVVMGVAQVKAETVDRGVRPGAVLAVDSAGRIVRAEAASTVTGAIVGTALEAADAARNGMIWVLVNPR